MSRAEKTPIIVTPSGPDVLHTEDTVVLLSSDERLCLPHEPPKSLVPALPLQFCSNYFPALLMVVVHPVTLEKERGTTFSISPEELVPLQVVYSQRHL